MSLIGKIYRAVGAGICAGALTIAAFSMMASAPVEAHSKHHQTPIQLATKLENQFWSDVLLKNSQGLTRTISDIFQGLNNGVIVNKSQEITALLALNFTSFTINNLVATEEGDVLVVSYNLVLVNTPTTSQNVVSVWKKISKHSKNSCGSRKGSHRNQWRLVSQSVSTLLV